MPTQTNPAPRYIVNGVEVDEEGYRAWERMLQATIEGERAEAAAYEAQLELVRPLNPTEALTAILAAQPSIAESIPDESLGRMQPYFPRWSGDGVSYARHESYVTYGEGDGALYRCETTHTSQADWTPDVAPSLWSRVLTSTTDVLPWVQPDSTNPYKKGDRVLWDGKVWESAVDNNVWMPGAVGSEKLWEEVA